MISPHKLSLITDRPFSLGVDPGQSGALALYNLETKQLVEVIDMPIKYTRTSGGKKQTIINGTELAFWLDMNKDLIRGAVIEDVHSMPRDGHVGAFKFGFNTGIVHGLINAQLIPIFTVTPSVWKMTLGLSHDKKLSNQKARVEFPNHLPSFLRAKDDGRAEAALLAKYGERIFAMDQKKVLI